MPKKITTLRNNLEPISIFLLFGILVLVVLFRYNPSYAPLPNRDSSVFSYIGQLILEGNLPYRDLWDHKGPAIYYINALGFYIGQGSRWGVWILQLLSLYSASIVGYSLMRKAFGIRPSIFSSVLWILTSCYLIRYGGNFTEEYSLLISFLSLYLFWLSRKSNSKIYIFLIGSMFSLSFLLRPNNTVIEISIAIFILIAGLAKHKYKQTILTLSIMALGALIILIPVISYFYINKAFDDFIDQVFIYNMVYSSSNLTDKISSIKIGLSITLATSISVIVLASWLVGFVKVCRGLISIQDQRGSLIVLALIALPVTLVLTTLSGRTYYHYYITWLPVFALLSSYAAYEFLSCFPRIVISLGKLKFSIGALCLTLVLIYALYGISINTYRDYKDYRDFGLIYSYKNRILETIDTITKYANDEQYLLMWGSEVGYNVITKKPSPSRYFYHNALVTCEYVNDEMIQEFIDDIAENKPLIVDVSSTSTHIPPIDSVERSKHKYIGFAANDNCGLELKMEKIFNFINNNYKVVDSTNFKPHIKWNIYKYNQ